MNKFEKIFLTVGTTEFNLLINEINKERFINILLFLGCKEIIIQYGRGTILPSILENNCLNNNIKCTTFRFKDSLDIEMNNASLIICHAGILFSLLL